MRFTLLGFSISICRQHPTLETWVMGDNNLVYIRDMPEDHVKNCLDMIMRHAKQGHTWKMSELVYGKLVFFRPTN